jgi:uncharacterized iron-regulated membrane protein
MPNEEPSRRLRTLAVVFGAPLGAVAAATGLARILPVSAEWALGWGYHLIVPLWVLLTCVLTLRTSARRHKIQRELHAWAGAAASVLLFVIFYSGVFALFNDDLAIWQGPATEPAVTTAQPSRVSYDAILSQIEQQVAIPPGASLTFDLPLAPLAEPGIATVSVYHAPSRLGRDFRVDRVTGEARGEHREHSRLSEELHMLHFLYRLPWGIELAGVVAVALFVTLASGVIMGWKDLLHTLRRRSPLRLSASDVHKALGVLSLPFAVSYAWSGALLGLLLVLALPLKHGLFGGDAAAYEAARSHRSATVVASGRPAARLPLDELTRRGAAAASAHFGAAQPLHAERLDIEHYRDENARFELRFSVVPFQKRRSVQLGPHGDVLGFVGDSQAPTEAVNRVLFDLHYARAGGRLIKALYALFALCVCAVIVSGNLVWLERRDPARSRAGSRALERSMLGVCLGLVLASAAYLMANRILPASLPRRADAELAVFLGAWLFAAALACARRVPRASAAALCAGAALGFGTVLVLDVVQRPAHLAAALRGVAPAMLSSETLVAALMLICACFWRGLTASARQVAPFRPEPYPHQRGSSLQ